MKLPKYLLILLISFTCLSVYCQNSTSVQNQQVDTEKSVVVGQQGNQNQNNLNELIPKLKGPDDMVVRKDVEVKNQSTSENQKSFFDLKSNERVMIGLLVLVLCFFIFGLVRYFLTGKQ